MTDDIDLGREVSNLLSEVRTVLSRARTALLGYDAVAQEWDDQWMSKARLVTTQGRFWWLPEGDPNRIDEVSIPHPDAAEIQAAMEKVVELLSPWDRTGRPLKKKP